MRVSINKVKDLVIDLFMKNGVSKKNSEIIAHCLVLAEIAGLSTHGLNMIPAHIEKCKQGYNINGQIKLVKEGLSFSFFDACNTIGMVSAWNCMEYGINKSEKTGVYTVFCGNANTFSAAYCFADLAIKNKKIAIIISNSPSQMAPYGGIEKLLGTNPLSIAIPANKEQPFILDMSTSTVAKSKINQAVLQGVEKIPFGWATDINGKPTDVPQIAQKGLMIPIGGAKGSGLAMAIDILSGLITGSNYLDNVNRFFSKDSKCMNVGHTFIVMDPKIIYGTSFFDEMDIYLNRIRTSKSFTDNKVLVPGDINMNNICECEEKGIEVNDKIYEMLLKKEKGY